jgi:DMSO/TMAO reductase YedYZ heme-binding membrane subunit
MPTSSSSSSRPQLLDRPAALGPSILEGWRLTAVAAVAIAAIAASILLIGALSEEAIRLALRTTARASLVLFLAAFTASATRRLWPNPFTRWQRRNRRYLGVAFAASHAIHAAMIISLAVLQPLAFHEHTQRMTPIPGSIGYLFILAMTVTSFDRTAAWLSRRAWNLLHTAGAFYLWFIFLATFVSRALRMPGYWLPAALVVTAMVVRVVAWRRQRRAQT